MIHGYDTGAINDFGLRRMREVSITAEPSLLRSLAKFMTDVATEMESRATLIHPNWHRHLPNALKQELGCDVIVCAPDSAAPRS